MITGSKTKQIRADLAAGVFTAGLKIYGKMPKSYRNKDVAEGFPDADNEDGSRKTYGEYLLMISESATYIMARLLMLDSTDNFTAVLSSEDLESLIKIVPINCIYSHEDALKWRDEYNVDKPEEV